MATNAQNAAHDAIAAKYEASDKCWENIAFEVATPGWRLWTINEKHLLELTAIVGWFTQRRCRDVSVMTPQVRTTPAVYAEGGIEAYDDGDGEWPIYYISAPGEGAPFEQYNERDTDIVYMPMPRRDAQLIQMLDIDMADYIEAKTNNV